MWSRYEQDNETVGKVLQVIPGLAGEHMTVLGVAREIEFARGLADGVLFPDGGRIVEQGPAGEGLRNPGHERIQDFMCRVTHSI